MNTTTHDQEVDAASTDRVESPSTRRSARLARRIAAAVAIAVLGCMALTSPASAATLPYATAGNLTCIDGTTIGVGQVTATVPNYFYPAQASANWAGELDYYRMNLQVWTNSGWQSSGPSSPWIPVYGRYYRQSGGEYTWDINMSGFYRVVYTMWWVTGQQGTAPTGYCHVEKPVGGGTWGMW